MSHILFFRMRGDAGVPDQGLSDEQRQCLRVWQPTPSSLKPRGLGILPFGVWWLFHALRVFRSRDYRVFMFCEGDEVVHRSCVFPAFFRFPFMRPGDLQVGDIWTRASHRGQGLSAAMLKHILALHPQRFVWFLCDAGNMASVNLAKSAGLELCGTGSRERRFGIGLLGRFVIQQVVAGHT